MLETEFQYFLDNQDELVKKYNGRFIVIKGKEVIGNHSTFVDAFYNTQDQGHELGSFLIQECLPGEECYTTILQVKSKESILYGCEEDGMFTDVCTRQKLKIIQIGKPTDGELTASIQVK